MNNPLNSAQPLLQITDWLPVATERTELLHGHEYPVRAQATSVEHARIASQLLVSLSNQIEKNPRPCYASIEGPVVKVDNHTGFIPDVFVECHRKEDADPLLIEPIIVIEVLSPSTAVYDDSTKFNLYLNHVDSVHDVLLINPMDRTVRHGAFGHDTERYTFQDIANSDGLVLSHDLLLEPSLKFLQQS